MRTPFLGEVVGLSHNWNNPEVGEFTGYIKAEPTNPVDSNAIAVFLDSGQRIGYIPSTDTRRLRIWGAGKTEWPVSIKVKSDEYYSFPFFASLKIVDGTMEQSPLVLGKKVALSGDFNFAAADSVKAILASYGAIIGSKMINRKTDLVVYESSIDTKALELKTNPEYHFEIISIWDLMRQILADKPHNDFFGKKVSVWFNTNPANYSSEMSFLIDFLVESGATISKYSKKDTDVLIDEKRWQRKHSIDAAEAGKKVCFIEDIIKDYSGVDITIQDRAPQSSEKEGPAVIKLERAAVEKREQSTQQSSKKGCLSVIVFLLAIPTALWLIASQI